MYDRILSILVGFRDHFYFMTGILSDVFIQRKQFPSRPTSAQRPSLLKETVDCGEVISKGVKGKSTISLANDNLNHNRREKSPLKQTIW